MYSWIISLKTRRSASCRPPFPSPPRFLRGPRARGRRHWLPLWPLRRSTPKSAWSKRNCRYELEGTASAGDFSLPLISSAGRRCDHILVFFLLDLTGGLHQGGRKEEQEFRGAGPWRHAGSSGETAAGHEGTAAQQHQAPIPYRYMSAARSFVFCPNVVAFVLAGINWTSLNIRYVKNVFLNSACRNITLISIMNKNTKQLGSLLCV